MTMKNLEPIQFALKSIRVDEFATISDAITKDDKVRLATGFNFGVDKDSNEVAVSLRISFETDAKKPFIILQVSCIYLVKPEDFQTFPLKDESTIQVRKDFLSHLSFLTVGTARGILYAKLESTPFQGLMLPIIDVTDVALNEAKSTLVS